eukprot:4295944-Alexandrium_andersonii.AAC.1
MSNEISIIKRPPESAIPAISNLQAELGKLQSEFLRDSQLHCAVCTAHCAAQSPAIHHNPQAAIHSR